MGRRRARSDRDPLPERNRALARARRLLRGVVCAKGVTLAGAAAAQSWPLVFTESTGTANPFAGISAATLCGAAFGDLDADGDLDALLTYDGAPGTEYDLNLGPADTPFFFSSPTNPFAGLGIAADAHPTFVDLDHDGDLDLVASGPSADGKLRYYQNTGTAIAPAFLERTGAANPLGGANVLNPAQVTFADLDADGDLDAVTESALLGWLYLRNTGNATAPAFAAFEAADPANPLAGTPAPSVLVRPAFADLDRDGDEDLVFGDFAGDLHWLENRGSRRAPRFVANDAGLPVIATSFATPAENGAFGPVAVDIDGDADRDLFVVGSTLRLFRDTADRHPWPLTVERAANPNPLPGTYGSGIVRAAFVDLDGDGDRDAVVGDGTPSLRWLPNALTFEPGPDAARDGYRFGNARVPNTALEAPGTNPFSAIVLGGIPELAFGDLDNDGDYDLVLTQKASGTPVRYFENTGTALAPAFAEITGPSSPVAAIAAAIPGGSAMGQPALVDLDADGDLDLVIGLNVAGSGTVQLWRNTGSRTAPTFAAAAPNPLAGIGGSGVTPSVSFADLDDDGDLDAAVNASPDARYYENTGSAATPAFSERTGGANPVAFPLNGQAALVFVDVDADGDEDVLASGASGQFTFRRNAGTARRPRFDVPADFTTAMGTLFRSALVDIDGDGGRDAFFGTATSGSEVFSFRRNTGTAVAPAFDPSGAGNPLSGWTFSGPGIPSIVFDTVPAFCDLDADGDFDMLTHAGSAPGLVRNAGTATAPSFPNPSALEPLPGYSQGPFTTESYVARTPVACVDMDGDGDLDIVAANPVGVALLRNAGTAIAPDFPTVEVTPSGSAPGISDHPLWEEATVPIDLDRDGDLDAATRQFASPGTLWLRNDGRATAPAEVAAPAVAFAATPTIASQTNLYIRKDHFTGVPLDADGDGDDDWLLSSYGTIDGGGDKWKPADATQLFENLTESTPPRAVELARLGPLAATPPEVSFKVVFDEPVSGVAAAHFAPVTAIPGVVVTGVAPLRLRSPVEGVAMPIGYVWPQRPLDALSTTWKVTVSTGSGGGTIGLAIAATSGIVDVFGNPLDASALPVASSAYTVAAGPPPPEIFADGFESADTDNWLAGP